MRYDAPRNPLGRNQFDWLDESDRSARRRAQLVKKRQAAKKRRDANRAARRCINDNAARTHAQPRAGLSKCDRCLEAR